MKQLTRVASSVLALSLAIVACNSSSVVTLGDAGAGDADTADAQSGDADANDSGHSEGSPKCTEIAAVCHPLDNDDGNLADQCHDFAHDNEVEQCAERYDECLDFCRGAEPNDAGADASHMSDAGHDGGHSGVCEELGQICHDLDDGGSALAHECHDVGHDGNEAACVALRPKCVALCKPAEVGDAGSVLCAELGELCHAFDDGGANTGTECHEAAHDNDAALCAAMYDDCVAFCAPGADAGG